jgi:hypothetical protein
MEHFMADQWLSIVEYARETGISDMTIRRRIRTGRISAELRDGKYFIPVTVDQGSGQISAVKSGARGSNPAIKSHPAPDKTLQRAAPIVQRHTESSMEFLTADRKTIPTVVSSNAVGPRPQTQPQEQHAIPEWLAKPLVDAGMASVEARGLIEFCHRALEQARATVSSVEARYASRLEALNAQIAQKDQEIMSLNQQVEDLQLLVQILERKK